MADVPDAVGCAGATSAEDPSPPGGPSDDERSQYIVQLKRPIPDELKYEMDPTKRGKCFIFNCESFDRLDPSSKRLGSEKDAAAIEALFKSLGYNPETFKDCTIKEMEEKLQAVAKDDSNRSVDSFVCTLLSHGKYGKIWAKDGLIKLQDLFQSFTESTTGHLQEKPKIFFVQACQGTDEEHDPNADGEWSYDIQSHPHLFVGFATPPGFLSWRNTKEGSCYIQRLCKIFDASITEDGASSPDLETLMIAVNRNQSLEFESDVQSMVHLHKKKQTSCIFTTLSKKVVFTKKRTAE